MFELCSEIKLYNEGEKFETWSYRTDEELVLINELALEYKLLHKNSFLWRLYDVPGTDYYVFFEKYSWYDYAFKKTDFDKFVKYVRRHMMK